MSTANRERLSVVARGEREIVMTRLFAAPRQLVFDAWTKPEMDVRPGGSYRYVMRRADGSQEIVMRGEYREVVPPERLVTTEAFEGFAEAGWRPEDATVSTTVLTERDGRTTWTATVLYPSQE